MNERFEQTLKDLVESGGQVLDLTDADAKVFRDVLNDSLFLFSWFVMGYADLDRRLHGELAAYVEALGTPGFDRIMTQVPRGHFKSSLGTIAHALWRVLRQPDEPVVIINAVEDNTGNWLRAIQNVVRQSPLVWRLYRDLLPPGVSRFDDRHKPQSLRWNTTEMEFEGRRMAEPEASISGYGRGSAMAGHHWPVMILDDLIGERERDSIADMQRAKNWTLTHTALMRPPEGSNAYVNCTPWTYDDVYCLMLERYGYKLYRRAALEDERRQPSLNGTPIFPKMFTREKLLRLYHANPVSFNAQYQCCPVPGEDQAFDIEWVRYFRVSGHAERPSGIHIYDEHYRPGVFATADGLPAPQHLNLRQLNVAAFLDPAPSEGPEVRQEPNARNGIVVEGIDAWGRRFVLEAVATYAKPIDVIVQLFRLARKWQFNRVYVEEVVFSVLYRHWIRHLQEPGQRFHDQPLAAVPVKPGRTNKNKRILDKVSGWQSGTYYLNDRGCDEFLKEFTEFPYGRTRDLLDAVAYDGELKRPMRDDEHAQLMRAARLRMEQADPVTGY